MFDDPRTLPTTTAGAAPRPSVVLRWIAWAPGALAIQFILMNGSGNIPGGGELLPYLLPAAHVALLPFLLRNIAFWGIRLMLLGLALNLAVMLANGGLMPVERSVVDAVDRHDAGVVEEGQHIPGTKNVYLNSDDVRLRELSDAIMVPLPPPFTRAVSAGDLLVFPGALLVLAEVALRNMRATPSLGLEGKAA